MHYHPILIQDKKILKEFKDSSLECAMNFFDAFKIQYTETDLLKINLEAAEFEIRRNMIFDEVLFPFKDFTEDRFISRYYQIGFKLDTMRVSDLKILTPYLIDRMQIEDKHKSMLQQYAALNWDVKKMVQSSKVSKSTLYRRLYKIWLVLINEKS